MKWWPLMLVVGIMIPALAIAQPGATSADIDQLKQDFQRETIRLNMALQRAVADGSVERVDSLLTAGADINNAENLDRTFRVTSTEQMQAVVDLLFPNNAYDRTPGETPLLVRYSQGSKGLSYVVQMLKSATRRRTEYEVTLSGYSRTPLALAVKKGDAAMTGLLLDRGADIEAAGRGGFVPLLEASREGFAEVARLLLNRGARYDATDTKGRTALMVASRNGHTEVMKLLIERGASLLSPDFEGMTPLMLASEGGHDDAVTVLLTEGAFVTGEDKAGRSALMHAAAAGHATVAATLLDAGAKLELADSDGRTAFMLACANGQRPAAELLIARGADIEAVDAKELNALMLATQNGHNQMVHYLVESGASLDARSKSGDNALMYAAAEGDVSLVREFIELGVSPRLKNDAGMTAYQIARRGGKDAVVRYLNWLNPWMVTGYLGLNLSKLDEAGHSQAPGVDAGMALKYGLTPFMNVAGEFGFALRGSNVDAPDTAVSQMDYYYEVLEWDAGVSLNVALGSRTRNHVYLIGGLQYRLLSSATIKFNAGAGGTNIPVSDYLKSSVMAYNVGIGVVGQSTSGWLFYAELTRSNTFEGILEGIDGSFNSINLKLGVGR